MICYVQASQWSRPTRIELLGANELMFCPSCGAENKDPGQRYCRECGATLVPADGRSQVVVRDSEKNSLPYLSQSKQAGLVDSSLKNKAIVGGVGLVVLVGALYVVVKLV